MVWIIWVGLALFAVYFFWWNKFENKDVTGDEKPDILSKAQTIMAGSIFKRKGLFMRPMIIDPSNMAASIKKNENTGGQLTIPEKPSDTAEKPDESDTRRWILFFTGFLPHRVLRPKWRMSGNKWFCPVK